MAKHPNVSPVALRPHSDQSKDRASKRLSSDSNGTSEGGMGSSTPVELTALEEAFRRFAIHGDTRATGKEMHGKNWSKLCKDCSVIDGKSVTLTDVDIVFSKVKWVGMQMHRTLSCTFGNVPGVSCNRRRNGMSVQDRELFQSPTLFFQQQAGKTRLDSQVGTSKWIVA